ncbi:MAG: phage integrase SAM-like domain-containing protein, partial [Flavisolibacter sp.]
MSVTANIILDTRRMKLRSGSFPLKLRVTFQRTTKDYQTIFSLSNEDFKKLSYPRLSANLQEIKDKLKLIKRNADECIDEISPFTFHEFERDFIVNNELFKPRKLKEPEKAITHNEFDFTPYQQRFPILTEQHIHPLCISVVYQSYIKNLLQEERIGTALSYQQAYNSFKKFKGNVCLVDITVSYLYQYEKWLYNNGCTRTTVGIRVRSLRTMFNEAISIGMIKKEKCYPFGRRKYQIPTGRNIKKALQEDQLAKIYFDLPANASEQKAKDFWFFCYYGNGMNPKDLLYLKNRNVQDDYICFIRAKTDRATRTDPRPIIVYITEDMWKVIQRWRNPDQSPDAYLFSLMDATLSPLHQYELVTNFTKFINDHMDN